MTPDNSSTIYDVAIIGGGIAGAGIARDAALRGLSVVLFEKNEFGSGASGKSSKLIHGGIRYLELSWNAFKSLKWGKAWKNLRFVFSSLKESRTLETIAPHLVKPISLIVPIYETDKRNPLTIIAGVLFYFLLARFSGKAKRPKIFWTQASLLRELPGLNPEGLKCGVMLWDHTTDDKALVRATIASAEQNGARCLKQAAVTGYHERPKEGSYEIRVRRNFSEEIFYSKKLINASGAWVDKTRALGREKNSDFILPVAGSHITVRKFLLSSTLLQAEDSRIFFVINTGETARVGTTEWICREPDAVAVKEGDIDYLLHSLGRYFPDKNFTRKDILSQDAGIRPLAFTANDQNPNEISRNHEIRVGSSGVLHVLGVKLTDHRRAAERVVDKIAPGTRSRTAHEPLG